MDLGLGGRTAYVTGGANGIGAAIATRLAHEGVHVAVADQDADALKKAATEWAGPAEPVLIEADLSTGTGVAAATDAMLDGFAGREPDILINNVALCISREFEDIDDEAWELTLQLNLMSYIRTCRALAPAMARRGATAIVNIASDLAKQPDIVPIDYGVTKSAVLHLSKALSLKYAPGVRVNSVLPGPVWTGLWSRPGGIADRLAEMYGTERDAAVEQYLRDRKLTLGLAEPDDVATLVTYVCSPLARRVNGAALDVGGTIHGLF